MNETIQTLLTRRSIRKYKPEQFPDDVMRQIIEAGLYAPSAMGCQPCHLVVVRGHDKITKVDREVKAATARMSDNPYKEFVGGSSYTINYHAPTFVMFFLKVRYSITATPTD